MYCYYEIANNMFVFWYQFVFPYMSSIAIGRGHQVLRNNIMPRIDLFAAHIFKKICLQYCYKLKKRNDFMCDFEQISPYGNISRRSASQADIPKIYEMTVNVIENLLIGVYKDE